MRQNNVLHVLTSLDFGGVESRMKLVSDNSHLSEWNHSFCALGNGGSVQKSILAKGARAEALGKKVNIPSPTAIVALWRYLRRLRPDILHLHGAEANFHGTIAGQWAGIPVIIAEEIGIPNHSPRARRIFSWTYRRCSRLIAISYAVKDQVVLLGEATHRMIEVVYNPFEPQQFQPLSKCDGQIRLGFVGRLEAVKNPLAAIDAVAILRGRGLNASLRIIGEGSQRPDIERRVAQLGLGNWVELLGFQPLPFAHLPDCHFYLQPSLSEGFGLAICEAMSAGIPVIASAVGGAPEIISHGATGWLLPNPGSKELADAVEAGAALDYESLAKIAIQARTTVMERFGVDTYLRRLDDLYRACA